MAVFLPVAFVGGIPAGSSRASACTMAFAIGVSLLVSFTLTPTLALAHARARRSHEVARGSRSHRRRRSTDPIERVYMRSLALVR